MPILRCIQLIMVAFLLTLSHRKACWVDCSEKFLDSDSYSDEMYKELVAQYHAEMNEESGGRGKETNSEDFEDHEEEEERDPEIHENLEESQDKEDAREIDGGETAESHYATSTESYRNAVERLQCDDPWFWNSFKCLWLDVRKRNFIERTKSNAITVAWIIGPPTIIILWFLCGFIIVAVFVRSRIKQVQRKIEELRNKYEPGKITLLDGTVKQYPPTKEETDAFEDLISSLVSLV